MNTIRGVNCEGLPSRRKRHSREKALSQSFSLVSLPCSLLISLFLSFSLDVDWSQFYFCVRLRMSSSHVFWSTRIRKCPLGSTFGNTFFLIVTDRVCSILLVHSQHRPLLFSYINEQIIDSDVFTLEADKHVRDSGRRRRRQMHLSFQLRTSLAAIGMQTTNHFLCTLSLVFLSVEWTRIICLINEADRGVLRNVTR